MGGTDNRHGSTWHQQTTSHVLNTQRHLVASLGTPAGPWQLPAKKWVLYPQYWYLLRKSHLVWIRRKICKGHAPFTAKTVQNISKQTSRDYCDVFISCLDSHSDGTHSLQRIHWWASDAMLNLFKSVPLKKQTQIETFWSKVSANVRFLSELFL